MLPGGDRIPPLNGNRQALEQEHHLVVFVRGIHLKNGWA